MKRLVFGYFLLVACGLFCFGFGRPLIAQAATPTYFIPNPPNERLKDFSVIEDNGTWHAFAMSVCISAPCVRPYSVIWHYVSRDLHTWTNLGVALAPRSGTIDSGDVWAPSVVGGNGQWTMFYTAVQYQGNTPIQRIAVATSNDLLNWNRQTNNLVLDCDSLTWAYWDLNDTQGIGGECRDPFVAWDDVSQRWLMTVSTRMTDTWGAHPMVIGQLWSDDMQIWHEVGPIPSTIGWTAESSHVVRQGGKNYIFWTKCPAGGTCLQWSSALSMQSAFSPAQSLLGVETWAYASEALIIDQRVGFFHVGIGVTEGELRFSSGVPTVHALELGTLEVSTAVAIPDVVASMAPGIQGASFLVYREQSGQGWNANEDLFLYSTLSDSTGAVHLTLPPGEYWLISDENDYLPGHVLATYAPVSYATPLSISWADVQHKDWLATVAPRRWNIGSQSTAIQRSAIPFTAASTIGAAFTSIHDVTVIGLGVEDASMMLSNDDGQTWWSLINSIWVEKPLAVEFAVPLSDLRAQLASFPIGQGQLRWQLFHSETAVPVTVDISLDSAPSVPTIVAPSSGSSVSTLQPGLTVQGSDLDGSSLIYALQYCGSICITVESRLSAAEWSGLQGGLAMSGQPTTWQPTTSIGNGSISWRVRVVDSGGAGMWSAWSPWSIVQTPPLVTASATARVVSLTSIELSWQSNTEATGIIFYADETDHEILLTSPQQQGIVLISDLELGGFYDFEIWLNDVYGQRAVTHVTKQLPTTATMMSSPQVWSDQAGLHISWQTNELATGSVRHSLSGGTLQTTPSLGTSTEHSVLITGYTPGQTVQYQISGQGATQYESMVFTYVVPNPPGLYVLPEEPDPVPILRPMRELRRPR